MKLVRAATWCVVLTLMGACSQPPGPTSPSSLAAPGGAAFSVDASSLPSLIGRFEGGPDLAQGAPLAAPANLVATVAGTTVSLQWTAAADPLVVSYMIEVGSAPNLADLGRYPSVGTSFVGAAPNGTYFVRVRAMDAGGALSAAASNEVTVVVTPSGNPALTFNVPQPPDGTVGTPYFFSFCGLAQQNNNGANCGGLPGVLFGGVGPYHFQLDTFGGFPPIGLVLSPNGTLSGTPSGALRNHSFRVCAVDTTGTNRCPTVTMSIDPRATCTPSAPTGMAGAVSGTTVTVSWNAAGCAASYVLEAGSAPGASDIFNADVGDATMLTAPGVPAGTYYIRVRAKDAQGTASAASGEVIVTVGSTVPPPGGTPGVWEIDIVDVTGYRLSIQSRAERVNDINSDSITFQEAPGFSNLEYRVSASGGSVTISVRQVLFNSCLLGITASGTAAAIPGRTFVWIARGTIRGTYVYDAPCNASHRVETLPVAANFVVAARR